MYRLNEKLSIIMPAYNEGKLIYNSISTTLKTVEKFAPDLEIIAVNDGSRDNTKSQIMKAMETDKRVRIVTSDKNRGKGNAIISGLSKAEGKYIAFVDADLEINPSQLEGYLKKMQEDNSDVVIGCKFDKDSHVEYPFKRKVISIGYWIMLMILFHLNVRDTQTGLKVFRADTIMPVAHLIRTSGFAYDIELLVAVNRRGAKITQMPVDVEYKKERASKNVRFKDIVQAFADTWKIFNRVYFRHYYD